MIDLKRCYQCEALKPSTHEYYYYQKRNRDGFSGVCRTCTNAQAVARYDKRLAELGKTKVKRGKQRQNRIEYMRRYRAANHERLRDYHRDYAAKRKRARYAQIIGGGHGTAAV